MVSASFPDGSGWVADQATISDCSGSGTTGSNNTGDLAAGATNTVCISVSVQESGSETGDDVEMTVSVTSDEDTTGTSTDVAIVISDWRASSNDGVQSYSEGDTNTYTISIENIKVDIDGNGVAIEDPIYVTLSNADEGWNIDSDNSAWVKLELTATINYIAADGTFDLELDIQLVGGIVPASSYINSNSNIVFSSYGFLLISGGLGNNTFPPFFILNFKAGLPFISKSPFALVVIDLILTLLFLNLPIKTSSPTFKGNVTFSFFNFSSLPSVGVVSLLYGSSISESSGES